MMSVSNRICISCSSEQNAELIRELKKLGYDAEVCDTLNHESGCHRNFQNMIQQDKLASLGTLVAGVAHELNNPNHFIGLNSELLSKAWPVILRILDAYYTEHGELQLVGIGYLEAKQRLSDALEGIHDGSSRIRSLVNELKSYARQQPLEISEPIDVHTVIRSATLLLSNPIKKCSATLEIDIADAVPIFVGHFQHIEQVLINLLQNACRAVEHRSKGQIAIKALYDEASNEILLVVEDNGEGIPPENLRHVTDPFFTTHREDGGTGLGLSVSLAIIHEHGGSLQFESEKGCGTKATIRLPVHAEEGT